MMKKALLLTMAMSLVGIGGIALADQSARNTVVHQNDFKRTINTFELQKPRATKAPPATPAPSKKMKAKFARLMDRYFYRFNVVDYDDDSRISLEEMARFEAEMMRDAFNRLDTNRDGLLSKAELRRAK